LIIECRVNREVLNRIINENKDEIGPTRIYGFGSNYTEGFSPEQTKIIKRLINSRHSSTQKTETKPQKIKLSETTPNSLKLTFINHILDSYSKTDHKYFPQAVEALSSLNPSSILIAFILRHPQDSLVEFVEKAKNHQNYLSDWEKQTIIKLFLKQHHLQTEKVVQSFLNLTSSS
jgi:hypothetical protein